MVSANGEGTTTAATLLSSEDLAALEKMEEPSQTTPSVPSTHDDAKSENAQQQQQPPLIGTQQDEILVSWDENDPMHPHSMSRARRWLITVIVSLGSICVYVYPPCPFPPSG